MLKSLIPQCKYRTTTTEFLEWYFYRSKADRSEAIAPTTKRKKIIVPKISEEKINAEWLETQVDSKEYPNKSELVNNYSLI